MTLQEKIILDLKNSMLAKNSQLTSLLRVVIGEFNRIGKELSDDQSLKIIKKMYDNAVELNNEFEKTTLDTYLPKMLTDKKLDEIIKDIITKNNLSLVKETGIIMNNLKTNYPSQYDGKVASIIIKNYLK